MDTRIAQQLVTQLASAVRAVNLYPAQHPGRVQPLTRMGTILEKLLQSSAVVYLAIEEDLLVVNAHPFFDPFPGHDELIDIFRERDIQRIEIQRTVTSAELRVLIALLALPVEDLANWESPRAYLETQGVTAIALEMDDEDLEHRAMQVYSDAKKYIVDLWKETRMGRIPKGDKAKATMRDLGALLSKDPSLLLGLTMLSDYDNYTFNHSVNVGVFALAVAEELGYHKERELIGLGGMLHDIGKTKVPVEIVNKPGRLTDEEWQWMRKHPEISGELVQEMELHDIFDNVRQHHCGYNRRGYPELPTGKELNDGSQITAVCDVYDSVTTLRPYQRQHTPQEGIEILLKLKANQHLNPKYVDTFARMLGIYPIGTTVRLNTGEIGIVVSINRETEDRPKLKIVRDVRGNLLRIPLELDLATAHGGGAASTKTRRIVGTLDPAVLGIRLGDYIDQRAMAGGGQVG